MKELHDGIMLRNYIKHIYIDYGRYIAYITADTLWQRYYSRYIAADILWQIYYGNYSTEVYYGFVLRRYIMAGILHYGRYITADMLRQIYYGRCVTADMSWPIHRVQQKQPYLAKAPGS